MTREFEVKKDQFVQTINGPCRKPLTGKEIRERDEEGVYIRWRGWDTYYRKTLGTADTNLCSLIPGR